MAYTPRFPISEVRLLIAYEMSKHSLYHPPSTRGRGRAPRRSKVRIARTREEQFLMLFTGLPGPVQELFVNADQKVQDAVWRQWNEELGQMPDLGKQLEDIIVMTIITHAALKR